MSVEQTNPAPPPWTTSTKGPGTARLLRAAIVVVGILLVAASRLPWFTVDVEAAAIVDVSLMGTQITEGIMGYRVGSDRMIMLALGLLIATVAGLWVWKVGVLLARPVLLILGTVVIAWSTLAFTEAGTVGSASGLTEGMSASIGPGACFVLGSAVVVLTILARVAASDLTASRLALDRMLNRGRAPVAAVFSRHILRAVERAHGAGHPETIRAALAHADCLVFAGFPGLAGTVLARVEARPELAQHPEQSAAARALRMELDRVANADGTPRPDFMGR